MAKLVQAKELSTSMLGTSLSPTESRTSAKELKVFCCPTDEMVADFSLSLCKGTNSRSSEKWSRASQTRKKLTRRRNKTSAHVGATICQLVTGVCWRKSKNSKCNATQWVCSACEPRGFDPHCGCTSGQFFKWPWLHEFWSMRLKLGSMQRGWANAHC